MELIRLEHDKGAAVLTAHGALPLHHVIGIGRNYAEHARETGAALPDHVLYFTKNPMALTLNGADIVVPPICQQPDQVDYEGELAVILGRPARDVAPNRALDCVLGYACANDVSARWWQRHGSGGQFCRGKSFDTFCPLGPCVVPAADIGDPQALQLICRVNGEVRQKSGTASMQFGVARLIADLSQGTTLMAGTVILTGTPAGVGMAFDPPRFLHDGDVVEVEIGRIGVLRNRVRFAPPPA